jgi:hypothetical protein
MVSASNDEEDCIRSKQNLKTKDEKDILYVQSLGSQKFLYYVVLVLSVNPYLLSEKFKSQTRTKGPVKNSDREKK